MPDNISEEPYLFTGYIPFQIELVTGFREEAVADGPRTVECYRWT